MDHRGDELNLLGHTLGEFLNLLVPPVCYIKADEPFLKLHGGVTGAHALELGKVHGLIPHLHLTVKAALLGEIADAGNVSLGDRMSLEKDLAFAGDGNAVDDTDEGTLTRSVWSKKAEYLALRDFQ